MKLLLVTICAALLLLPGCSDDECVQCTGQTQEPTLDNIWPNKDKTSWTYAFESRQWDQNVTIYPTRDDIPSGPLPTWSEIFDLVEAHAPKEPYISLTGVYKMRFDGMKTTESGVTAQNLVTEFVRDDGQSVQNLAPEVFEQVPIFHYLIHGGAWEKTTEWIGSYGDLNEELAWKFLTSDLSVGSEFSFPLLSMSTEGPMLRGRVHRQIDVKTDIGTFATALDCLYLVDLGILTVVDLEGNVDGYIRVLQYGRVIYAPTSGPVYDYERWGVELGDSLSDGWADVTMSIVQYRRGGFR